MDSDEEVFEDALDEVQPKEKVSKKTSWNPMKRAEKNGTTGENDVALGESLEDARVAIQMFLNNNFDDARNIVQPLADRSIYHALGYGVFMYLKAVMTFEEKHIEEASTVLSQACETIGRFRRKSGGIVDSLGRMLRKADYDSYTESELHAELCFAEVLLLKAVLTLCEDETLVSFVKAGLKVRTCYQSFRECWSVLQQRNWENSEYKNDFESGVRLGVGTFNLMISLLPGRIMKLLEFIGFGGNRESGIQELNKVYENTDGIRQFLACLVLLGYHLILSFFLGNSECDLRLCQEILDHKLAQYPKGAFFLFFKGRFHFIQGQMPQAIKWYKASCDSQDEWPQFHHVCYWELIWAHQYSRDWWNAYNFAGRLFEESRWSKCFYGYQKATQLCMLQDELSPEHREEQIELMSNVPTWKQRIAGKSLPMEKFAIKKAERFLEQGNRLTLPSLELIYVWNGFKILGQSWNLIEPMYVLVEDTMKKLQERHRDSKFYNDDYCLLVLLRGMCLKHMDSPLQAEECFKIVVGFHGKLQADTYLVPYAMSECALLLRDQGNFMAALDILEKAKSDFKDYTLQSRLHFRIHAAQTEIRAKIKAAKRQGLLSSAAANDDDNGDDDVDKMLPFAEDNEMQSPLSEDDARNMLQGR